MKRTKATTVLAAFVIGAVVGFGIQALLTAIGQVTLRPAYTLAITLGCLAAIVIAVTIPVARSTRGTHRHPVNPFYATRVVMLAKAATVVGALLAGVGGGFLADLVLRSVAPADDAFARTIWLLASAVVLVVAGLVAEFLCRVPPEDPKKKPKGEAAQDSVDA